MEKTQLLLLGILLFCIQNLVCSQELGNLKSDSIRFVHKGDNVYVTINVPLRNYYIANNTSLLIEPVIWADEKIVTLPKVALDDYSKAVKVNSDIYALQYFNNHYDISYTVNVPYEPWMDVAKLVIRNNLNSSKADELYTYSGVLKHSLENTPHNRNYAESVAAKTKSNFKNVSQNKDSDFKLKSKMVELYYPAMYSSEVTDVSDYTVKIAEICETIDGLVSDNSYQFMGVYIASYTSPDDITHHNKQRARERAENFRSYLQRQCNLPDSYFQTFWSEDWAGLVALLNNDSKVPYQGQALNIINNVDNLAERSRRLANLAGGASYNYMEENLFPRLQKIECNIIYKKLR